MIYIVSDTHFFHRNIIEYCDRPYDNIEIMNEDIVNKWNSIVKEDDIVFHLGDVGFGLVEQLQPIVHRLNGHKILLRGNHDMNRGTISWTNIGFEFVYKKGIISLQDFNELIMEMYGQKFVNFSDWEDNEILFSHSPKQCDDSALNIHGHMHNVPLDPNTYNLMNHICTSIEMIDYKPISLDEVLSRAEMKKI